jgi:hypothetical protein
MPKINLKEVSVNDDIGKEIYKAQSLLWECVILNTVKGDILGSALSCMLGELGAMRDADLQGFKKFVNKQIEVSYNLFKEQMSKRN